MSTYPEKLDALATNVEDRDRGKTGEPDKSKPTGAGFHAGLHNHVNEAVMAIEQTLGIKPQGGTADVASRLAAIDAAIAGGDSELTNAVATLTSAINAKQDASTAATDSELASAVVAINSALALKQDAATAATDSELASEKAARESGDSAAAAAASAAQTTADAALPKAGGIMTGAVTLAGDPTANLHPATKQYLEAKIAALINGAPGTLDTLKEIADRLGSDESAVSALTGIVAGKLGASANLSDLADAVAARANLGAASTGELGSEQTARESADSTEKGRAEAAEALRLAKSENLKDLVSASTARTNLGLGTSATKDVGAAGEAGKVLLANDAFLLARASKAEVEILNLGTDWSAGDSVTVFTPDPAARKLHIKSGTAESPDTTYGSLARFSRTLSIPESSFSGDGGPGLAAVYGASKVLASSEGQGIGVYGGAVTAGTHIGAHSLADGIGLYGVGRALAGSTRTGMGLFANGRREDAGAVATGAEIACDNETATAGTYNKAGASSTKGIFLHATGTADVGCGLQLGHPSTPKFEVGIGINEGAVGTASFRDDSSATRSVLIKGTHEKAAIAVASGAGQVVIGAEEPSSATPLLELYAGEANFDPMLRIGTGKAFASSAEVRTEAGNCKIFASASTNGFLNESGNGGTGIQFSAAKIFSIGRAGGVRGMLRLSEGGIAVGEGAASSFGGGKGVVFLANTSTAPSTNPTGGGILYCEGGKLMYRGSSGTVKELAAA